MDASVWSYDDLLAAARQLTPSEQARLIATLAAHLADPHATASPPPPPASRSDSPLEPLSVAPSGVPQLVSSSVDARSGLPRVRLPLDELPRLVYGFFSASKQDESRLKLEQEARREQSKRQGKGYLPILSDLDEQSLVDAHWGLIVHRLESCWMLLELWPLIEHRLAERKLELSLPPKPSEHETCEQWYEAHKERVKPWLFLYNGRSCAEWLASNYGLSEGQIVVDPRRGLPYYLLIAGRPVDPQSGVDEITAVAVPFEFQYQLDLAWAVGRVCFTDANGEHRREAYGTYARHVVAYEQASRATPQPAARQVALFAPLEEWPASAATRQVQEQLIDPVAKRLREQGVEPTELRHGDATRDQLVGLLQTSRPDLLVAASRGMAYAPGHADQTELQGAMICQDWLGEGYSLEREQLLAATDLDAIDLRGMIALLVVCFGAGCAAFEQIGPGAERPLAQHPFVAQMPQTMLERGALAVFGHVNETWSTMFTDLEANVNRQSQAYDDVIAGLLAGHRAGAATDTFNLLQGAAALQLSAKLQDDLRDLLLDEPDNQLSIANSWLRLADARNYILLGDPAVRLWAPTAA